MSYYVLWDSPTLVTEFYSRMVDNFVDNVISVDEFGEHFGNRQYGEHSKTN